MGLLNDVMDDGQGDLGTLIHEDENFRYWKNGMCNSYERSMREYDKEGTASNELFKVFLVEGKRSNDRFYCAFDRKGVAFMNWCSPYEFDMKMVIYRQDLKEDSDIVNMAKRIKDSEKDG